MRSELTPLKLLGVETSSPLFSVALLENGRIVSHCESIGQGRPSALLSEMIREMTERAKLPLPQLDGFVIGIGPGSFTGLRVGVTTIKTLAWALKKPVLPISSLEVIARNLNESTQDVVVFLDARKGKVYSSLFSPDRRQGLVRQSEDKLLMPEEVLKKLEQPVILVGDGIHRYSNLITRLCGGKVEWAPEVSWIPRAEELCQIAAKTWPKGRLDDPHRLVPKYLYSQESDITGW